MDEEIGSNRKAINSILSIYNDESNNHHLPFNNTLDININFKNKIKEKEKSQLILFIVNKRTKQRCNCCIYYNVQDQMRLTHFTSFACLFLSHIQILILKKTSTSNKKTHQYRNVLVF